MASIKISDLRPSDFNFLGDSESFLNDLSDSDLATINGGDEITIKTKGGTTITIKEASFRTADSLYFGLSLF